MYCFEVMIVVKSTIGLFKCLVVVVLMVAYTIGFYVNNVVV